MVGAQRGFHGYCSFLSLVWLCLLSKFPQGTLCRPQIWNPDSALLAMFVRSESFWIITVTIILPWDTQQQCKKQNGSWGRESLEKLGAINQVADKVQTQHCEAEDPEIWFILRVS